MWFQSPEYLRWTRLYHLSPENRDHILALLNIHSGERVLDVGCGSGEFTRYIALDSAATFTGVDNDPPLIDYACSHATGNTSYLLADACRLPFPDGSFDLIVSHTFFTSVADPAAAMKEMRRVCKPGGRIASITPDSFNRIPYSNGHYTDCPWMDEYRKLKAKLDQRFLEKAMQCISGVVPEEMPYFFATAGLQNVRVYQIGKFFSLSNATLCSARRKEYLDLEIEAEKTRVSLLDTNEQQRYLQLLEVRKQAFLSGENTAWEWIGGSNLLIMGDN